MNENRYNLIKEIEKQYGDVTTSDPMKNWDSEKEEKLHQDLKTKSIKKYINSKSKKEPEKKEIISCNNCKKGFSPRYIDQIHIKKYGLCFDCYTKAHF